MRTDLKKFCVTLTLAMLLPGLCFSEQHHPHGKVGISPGSAVVSSWGGGARPGLEFDNVVYKSSRLMIIRIAESSYQHISYKQTQDYGNVPCNGLIVTGRNEAIVFDTPTTNEAAAELIDWLKNISRLKINAVIVTHFHDDSIGGLQAFHDLNIPSYAFSKTIELAKENNYVIPGNSFSESLILKAGEERVLAKFFGEGHTPDNVVGFFPKDGVLFGGCLLKEMNAGKGYLGDANLKAWPGTVESIKKEYPNVKIVVPGHGNTGDKELLTYTINLFRLK